MPWIGSSRASGLSTWSGGIDWQFVRLGGFFVSVTPSAVRLRNFKGATHRQVRVQEFWKFSVEV